MISRLLKAKKIVDEAQAFALGTDRDNDISQEVLPDKNLGLDITNDHNSPEGMEQLRMIMGRPYPYRYESEGRLKIRTLDGKEFISLGNELENGINQKQVKEEDYYKIMNMNIPLWEKKRMLGSALNAKEWGALVCDNFMRNGNYGYASPSLMTLKQSPVWKKVVKFEDCFSVWCVNTHVKCFARKKESGIGDYFENIRIVAHLIHFKELTKKPVIFTELGGGEYHYALGRADVNFLYYIHKAVFGDRMIMGLYYNSALMQRCMGYNQIEER